MNFFLNWFVVLVLNQFLFYNGCIQLYCIKAALFHTGVIAFILTLISISYEKYKIYKLMSDDTYEVTPPIKLEAKGIEREDFFKSERVESELQEEENENVNMTIQPSITYDSTKVDYDGGVNSLWGDDEEINNSVSDDYIGGDYKNKEFNEQDVSIAIQFSIMNNNEWELLHASLDKTKHFLNSSGWIEKDNYLFLWTEVNDDNKYKYIQLDYDSNGFPVLRAGFMEDNENIEDSSKPLDYHMFENDEVTFKNIEQSIVKSLENISTSREVLMEFVLFELDGLVLSGEAGKKFVENSGFEANDYTGITTKSDEADILFDIFMNERSIVVELQSEGFIRLSIAVLDNIMQKYSLGKYQSKEDEEGCLKQDEQYYKELYNNIPIFLKSQGIDMFYHFTDIGNLESIIENGGLYSWKGLENKCIKASLSSDELSRQLDTKKSLQDYIRLSFTDYHPMSTKVEKEDGKKLVWLEIDLDIALWESTLFSDMNATDNNVTVRGDFDFLKTLDFDIFRQKYNNLDILEKKKYQAEILVKDFLPIKYIKNINELKENYLGYEEIPF